MFVILVDQLAIGQFVEPDFVVGETDQELLAVGRQFGTADGLLVLEFDEAEAFGGVEDAHCSVELRPRQHSAVLDVYCCHVACVTAEICQIFFKDGVEEECLSSAGV